MLWLGKLLQMVVHEYQRVFFTRLFNVLDFEEQMSFIQTCVSVVFPGEFDQVEIKKKNSHNLQERKS